MTTGLAMDIVSLVWEDPPNHLVVATMYADLTQPGKRNDDLVGEKTGGRI
jgi:hypothetical protein